MGTWQTFDVSDTLYPTLKEVLQTLYSAGGRLLDSSPMYGRAEEVIGAITEEMEMKEDFFYATKVWTSGEEQGIRQMEASFRKMKRTQMDLVQIHNLADWRTHLHTLRRWKEIGKIRYLGITHYADSSHEELERIMRAENIDFVQFNYSIGSRHAEKRLLEAAADLGIATLINRPFGEGHLFSKVKGKPLPSWAKEYQIESWGAYFLFYVLAHPAVTCVIPATSNPQHAFENTQAGWGTLPDEAAKKRMLAYWESL